MTLHTRIAVTGGDVTVDAAFSVAANLIGVRAGDRFTHHHADGSRYMDRDQGLPALLWVTGPAPAQPCDTWCESDCDRRYHDPAHRAMIHFDTSYVYRDGQAGCGDLHAWLVQQVGAWLEAREATYEWYDESGHGWAHGPGWGTLGDPSIGKPSGQPANVDNGYEFIVHTGGGRR